MNCKSSFCKGHECYMYMYVKAGLKLWDSMTEHIVYTFKICYLVLLIRHMFVGGSLDNFISVLYL